MEKFNITALNRAESREMFGTWFSKDASVEQLIVRFDEQLENCKHWIENLDKFKKQLELERLNEKKDELKNYLRLIGKEEAKALYEEVMSE